VANYCYPRALRNSKCIQTCSLRTSTIGHLGIRLRPKRCSGLVWFVNERNTIAKNLLRATQVIYNR
jgi:hypothetical protein